MSISRAKINTESIMLTMSTTFVFAPFSHKHFNKSTLPEIAAFKYAF